MDVGGSSRARLHTKTCSPFIIETLKDRQHLSKISELLTQKMRKLKPKILVLIRECLLQMNSFVQFQDSEWIAIIL